MTRLVFQLSAIYSTNLEGLNVVELVDGVLDLVLVGVVADDEDKGVVLLDFLHGRLSGQWVLDDAEVVHLGCLWGRLAWEAENYLLSNIDMLLSICWSTYRA